MLKSQFVKVLHGEATYYIIGQVFDDTAYWYLQKYDLHDRLLNEKQLDGRKQAYKIYKTLTDHRHGYIDRNHGALYTFEASK